MSDQYSRRLSSVLSSSGVPSGSAAQDGFTERRIPVMAADGIVIHRIERVHESAGDGVDGYGYVEGPKARNKIRMQDEGASNAQDGDSSSEEELLEFPETTPEEMISLALAQPNHWALREKPTLQMRSHSNGTCTPCMFFLLCNRCHFGRSCGCCHAVSHQNKEMLRKFRFTKAADVRYALYPRRPLKQEVGNGQGTSSSGTLTTASSNRGNRGEYRASTYRVPTHVQEAQPRPMTPIGAWLLEMDGGNGALLQYQLGAEANFDSVAQIVNLYARQVDSTGQTAVDPLLFQDLCIKKVGHQRLIEKWFRERALGSTSSEEPFPFQ